mmetsp:Transcript_2717/g.10929  ORF Transcript_2717/g.10929 Transcript_2717/m.10929 type:complete len:615 (+) Transcript_2717:5401-7245(+)
MSGRRRKLGGRYLVERVQGLLAPAPKREPRLPGRHFRPEGSPVAHHRAREQAACAAAPAARSTVRRPACGRRQHCASDHHLQAAAAPQVRQVGRRERRKLATGVQGRLPTGHEHARQRGAGRGEGSRAAARGRAQRSRTSLALGGSLQGDRVIGHGDGRGQQREQHGRRRNGVDGEPEPVRPGARVARRVHAPHAHRVEAVAGARVVGLLLRQRGLELVRGRRRVAPRVRGKPVAAARGAQAGRPARQRAGCSAVDDRGADGRRSARLLVPAVGDHHVHHAPVVQVPARLPPRPRPLGLNHRGRGDLAAHGGELHACLVERLHRGRHPAPRRERGAQQRLACRGGRQPPRGEPVQGRRRPCKQEAAGFGAGRCPVAARPQRRVAVGLGGGGLQRKLGSVDGEARADRRAEGRRASTAKPRSGRVPVKHEREGQRAVGWHASSIEHGHCHGQHASPGRAHSGSGAWSARARRRDDQLCYPRAHQVGAVPHRKHGLLRRQRQATLAPRHQRRHSSRCPHRRLVRRRPRNLRGHQRREGVHELRWQLPRRRGGARAPPSLEREDSLLKFHLQPNVGSGRSSLRCDEVGARRAGGHQLPRGGHAAAPGRRIAGLVAAE